MPWLTPEDIPEGEICRPLSIPADTAWMAFFSGALTELTKSYNWEQFGALSVDDTVQKMQEIVNDYFLGGCGECELPGGVKIIRITEDGHLEEFTDGAWIPATGDYAIPPPEARTDGSESDQICLAAKNAVNVMSQLYEIISDAALDHLSEAEALILFTAGATALILWEFAPITAAIAAFFFAAFKLLYVAASYLFSDYWDADFTKQMTCFLVDCASNDSGVVTFDYQCFMAKLNSLANNFSLTENQILLYLQVGYLLYFIGGMDGLNAAGGTNEVADDDCEFCDDTWCYQWDLTSDVGNWGIYPGQPGTVDGSGIHTGLTYVSGDPSRGRQQTIVQMVEDLTAYNITEALFYVVSSVGNTSAAGLANGVWKNAFASVISPVTTPVSGTFPISTDVAPGTDVTSIQAVFAVGGCDGCGDPGGTGTMYLIELHGTGVRPTEFFGGMDCP